MGLLWLFVGILVYFIPSMVALIRKKRHKAAIILFNLFLGWTVIGWIVALIWATMFDGPVSEEW
jgi:hypothetical protein